MPISIRATRAPELWKSPVQPTESRLHQIAPYIGKLKPNIAGDLIARFTNPGDLVLDCFSGSGTIPVEAALRGRSIIALDRNPYAVTLTRAKLFPPASISQALDQLSERLEKAMARSDPHLEAVPGWVRQFFHPDTLTNILRFADECIEKEDHFLFACLLGILHHQRPGFLSYPSSHLVPYLRDRKFPRGEFPLMYEAREIGPRLIAKVTRALKTGGVYPACSRRSAFLQDIRDLSLSESVDAIVTSPPYMNALDYVRDNRLRMWFVDRQTTDYTPEPTDKPGEFDSFTDAFCSNAVSRLRVGGRCVLVVGQTVQRKRQTSHPAERMLASLMRYDQSLSLEEVIEDEIPDVRRSRRNASGTKRELILVLVKRNGVRVQTTDASSVSHHAISRPSS